MAKTRAVHVKQHARNLQSLEPRPTVFELLQESDLINLVLLSHSPNSPLIFSTDSILHTICRLGEKALQDTKGTWHHQ